VTRVYVDLDAVSSGTGESRSSDREAVRSLEHLVEAGHEVVLVCDGDAVPVALGEIATTAVAAAPTELTETAWYLVSDVDRCRDRTTRLRTVLIGSLPAPGAIHRCDRVARDLMTAVLEILADEAMSPA
jgi:hypothetical protein